jgi:hypothetical protein
MSPYESDDLTEVVERRGGTFVVLQSSEAAEHTPSYRELAEFSTREQADAYLETVDRHE